MIRQPPAGPGNRGEYPSKGGGGKIGTIFFPLLYARAIFIGANLTDRSAAMNIR